VAEGWNFGPDNNSNLPVEDILELSKQYWDAITIEFSKDPNDHHEANLLMLDCSKANKVLKWKAVWGIDTTIAKTIGWYKEYYLNNKVNSALDLKDYVTAAKNAKIAWAL
jgi:CDP-glucose 4,6-dehydratase